MLDRSHLSPLDPLTAVSVVVATAPVGYLRGWLIVSHVVAVATAVWLSTVVVAAVALLVTAAR
jgi:hypothetical protein